MAGTLRRAVHSQSPRLILSAWLALVLMAGAVALIAYYVPEDADQGLSQKIFYFHVPIALTAYACFGWGERGRRSAISPDARQVRTWRAMDRLEQALQDLSLVREARADEPVPEEPLGRVASAQARHGAVEAEMR